MPKFLLALASATALMIAPDLSAQECGPGDAPGSATATQSRNHRYSVDFHAHVVQHDRASRALEKRVRADIENLRFAQESYFACHGRHADSLRQLTDFTPTSGAEFALSDASREEYHLEVTHRKLPGSTLRVHVRRTDS